MEIQTIAYILNFVLLNTISIVKNLVEIRINHI